MDEKLTLQSTEEFVFHNVLWFKDKDTLKPCSFPMSTGCFCSLEFVREIHFILTQVFLINLGDTSFAIFTCFQTKFDNLVSRSNFSYSSIYRENWNDFWEELWSFYFLRKTWHLLARYSKCYFCYKECVKDSKSALSHQELLRMSLCIKGHSVL